jgi:hypothetical protein
VAADGLVREESIRSVVLGRDAGKSRPGRTASPRRASCSQKPGQHSNTTPGAAITLAGEKDINQAGIGARGRLLVRGQRRFPETESRRGARPPERGGCQDRPTGRWHRGSSQGRRRVERTPSNGFRGGSGIHRGPGESFGRQGGTRPRCLPAPRPQGQRLPLPGFVPAWCARTDVSGRHAARRIPGRRPAARRPLRPARPRVEGDVPATPARGRTAPRDGSFARRDVAPG